MNQFDPNQKLEEVRQFVANVKLVSFYLIFKWIKRIKQNVICQTEIKRAKWHKSFFASFELSETRVYSRRHEPDIKRLELGSLCFSSHHSGEWTLKHNYSFIL